MPRISQRRILLDWFLDEIEKDKAHIEAESLGKFLERHIEAMRNRVRDFFLFFLFNTRVQDIPMARHRVREVIPNQLEPP